MRSDDSAGETVTTIETDTVATCGAVDLNLAGVGRETLRGVFSSDAALDGETASRDTILC